MVFEGHSIIRVVITVWFFLNHSFVRLFLPLICPVFMSDCTGRISLGINSCTIYWLFKSALSTFSIHSTWCSFYAYLTFKNRKCCFFMVFTWVVLNFCVHNLWCFWWISFCYVVNCRSWKILKHLNPLMSISSFTGIHIQDMLKSIMSTGLLRWEY